jgi:hypothetical protein
LYVRAELLGEAMTDHVSIRPNVGMLSLFPHMKYQPWYAVGELVDNSIQSYLANRDRLHDLHKDDGGYLLRVDIEISKVDGGSIAVRDNAAGIDSVNFQRAFRVAEPPADATGLSQFGVGMKAAAAWFAKEFEVRSTALGESVVRTVAFDIPSIVATRTEELDVVDSPTSWDTHFTEVRLWNLNRIPQTRTIGKMKEYLGSIYRQFLRNGDVVITFDGQPISYEEPAVLVTTRWDDADGAEVVWRKTVEVHLESGRRVHGWGAIRERGQTSQPGFALLYRGKVVQGAGDDVWKPEDVYGRSNSFRSQRVFGELIMDDFAVTYTKDALVWHDEEQDFIELLKVALDSGALPLLKQAENYRVRVIEPAPAQVVDDVISKVATLIPTGTDLGDIDLVYPQEQLTVDLPAHGEESVTRTDVFETVERPMTVRVHDRTWNILLRLVAEEAVSDWLRVQREDALDQSTVTVTVNQAHPFMRNFAEIPNQDLEPVWRLAVALGLGVQLARDGGDQAGLVLVKVNSLLRNYLAVQV